MSHPIEFSITVLTSVTSSAGLTGFVLFFTKSYISERLKNSIKNEYDQKLESHKAILKADTEKEVERLKAQLQIASKEHEIRYTRLHERRAETIAETYSRLKKMHMSLGSYVDAFEMVGGPSRKVRRQQATDAHEDFRDYYLEKLIFFPKETARKLEKLDLECVRAFNEFAIRVDGSPDTTSADLKVWLDVLQRVSGEIAEALRDLEDNFRDLLGDKH